VTCTIDDGVAVIALDDGKANAITHAVLDAVGDALDQAETDSRAVVIHGRPGRFSGGFDLATMTAGPEQSMPLLQRGAALASRLYGFPTPIVLGCTGHAVAMGAILLMSGDLRVGAAGSFKIGLNEVAIGMPVPRFALTFARDRLAPTTLPQAIGLARLFEPDDAVAAGFLDQVVDADQVVEWAIERAAYLANALDPGAFRVTRHLLRADVLGALGSALDEDMAAFG
jgi:enoyl-CoA hydratase